MATWDGLSFCIIGIYGYWSINIFYYSFHCIMNHRHIIIMAVDDERDAHLCGNVGIWRCCRSPGDPLPLFVSFRWKVEAGLDGGRYPGGESGVVSSVYCGNGQHFVAVGYEVAAGAVQMYRVAHRTLEPLGKPVSSVGRHPCYLARSKDGNYMLVANYSEGSVASASYSSRWISWSGDGFKAPSRRRSHRLVSARSTRR